ncbi:3,4-dihydroxy-2-butanone-4-phosphate synthase [candidate division KSB1 bacterium]|nr:3,4-dihydroxy-2-butanone-4-phosphate synthase [candidate division KSB1 bacterium]
MTVQRDFSSVEQAIEAFRRGEVIIVMDAEDRENEGDFICAAEKCTPEIVNFMITHGRGQLCMPVLPDICERLKLGLMVDANTTPLGTSFTVPVDHRSARTGITAAERARAIEAIIDPDSKSQLTLTASSLQVNGAHARLETQTLEDQGTVEVGDSLHLVFARVKSGAITLNLQGNFPVRTRISIALPDFRSPWNDTLKSAITLSPNGGGSLLLDLAGYTLQPQPAAFGHQKIRFLWKVSTLNAAHEFVALTSAANLSATCASTKIIFSEVQGAFVAKQIALEPQTFNLDLPAGLDSLRLLDTRLQIILRNGINFPVQTDLRLEGFPERGPKVQLVVRERIAPAQADGIPVETQILLAGNAMQNFLNALPRTIKVSGKVWVGQRSYSGSVRARDAVATTLRFDAPLALVLPAQKVESEVSTITFDESTRERISKNLVSGGVKLRLDNRLPFEASAAVHIARNANEVFRKPDLIVGPVQIALPQLDPMTGRALQPRRSEATLALNETQLKLFQTSPLYVGVLLTLPGSNGKVIRLAADDYVDVQGGVNLRLQMNENTLK